MSFERMVRAKTLDARLRVYDSQEVIPAKAGIQEPYIQLQTALMVRDTMTQAEQRSDEHCRTAQAEIESLKQELSREHDLHLRALADFDNYRKRVQRERDSAAQAGKRQLMLALLDVLDDFERALAYANTAPESIVTGARVIHKRLTDLMQVQGVVPYTSTGQPFDPALHEAVDVINTAQAAPGVVLNELRHGYRWGDEVLRPARVRVAQ